MNRTSFAAGAKRSKKEPKPGDMVWTDTVFIGIDGKPNGFLKSKEPILVKIEKCEQRYDGKWWMVSTPEIGNFWRRESQLHI